MFSLKRILKKWEDQGREINIGLIGAGRMGTGLAVVLSKIPAMNLRFVVDLMIDRAADALIASGVSRGDIINVDEGMMGNWDLNEKKYISTDYRRACSFEGIDMIVDATGDPEAGAEISLETFKCSKDLVMLNIEADATIGPWLKKLAADYGVLYTVTSGDEPGAIMEIYNFVDLLGFEIIAAGKGKNNVLDRKATPDSVAEFAKRQGINPRLICAFIDGSKSMVEMTVLSNATGFVPDVRGMHTPNADVKDLTNIFRLKEDGGILNREGIVDFVIGDVAPGVFMVVRHDEKIVTEDLVYLKLGKGPVFTIYRPYHLANIETPTSMAYAAIYREPILVAEGRPYSEAITVTKRDIRAGETLDGIGGFTVYGSIDEYDVCRRENLLPLGLAFDARVKKDIKKDEFITYDMVDLKETLLLDFRRKQDQLFSILL